MRMRHPVLKSIFASVCRLGLPTPWARNKNVLWVVRSDMPSANGMTGNRFMARPADNAYEVRLPFQEFLDSFSSV